ncbi:MULTISPECIES: dynamin family protein [unclassified Thermosynechococcus]|uniref:dynamin family protein n=1 Tax=unclassified Thermosynechococcus TaxID=2622553 RepID=UPI002877AF65|nr:MULTISPECIES: dynamin family protein [unclassified Thermosynechococcus]WNC52398.1 dynamin family protein [Thermosynechococcus sp. TG215]WNC57484.1 dynamin family protein [Thermosynechococcus sp. TG218]
MATAIPPGIPQDVQPSETLLEDLRQDVIHLLKQTVGIVERYNSLHKTAERDSSQEKTEFSGTAAIRQALTNVEEMALRMSVVAPMKAGKSTIINAIVGQPLLPARNTAMTATATEIVLDTNYPEPVLFVPEETLALFKKTAAKIRQEYNRNRDNVAARLQKYPHLDTTFENIIRNDGTLFKEETTGVESVREALQLMNDLVRLASQIVPAYNPVKRMRELPQIRVAPFTSEGEAINTALGNLVIIDTPGPNEAGENLEIKNIFAEQLERSSLILVVLDFTQLKTEAAKSVQETVQAIAEIRGGTENIYALVNKVDQRRRGDMTPAEVREFVQQEFRIPSSHVFELSAQRAYCAARFLKQHDLGEDWRTRPEARDLAREILGDDWEEDLEDIDKDAFTKKARKQWYERSGFYQFFTKVISELIKIAAPKVIRESLNITHGFIHKLLEDINLRKRSYQATLGTLEDEIKQLNQDIKKIENSANLLNIIEEYQKEIKNQIASEVSELKNKARADVSHLFSQKEYEQADVLKKVMLFLTDFAHKLTNDKSREDHLRIPFSSRHDAEDFQGKIFNLVSQEAEKFFGDTQKKIEKFVGEKILGLKKEIEEETQPILEKARERLQMTFNVQLSLPDFQVSKASFGNSELRPEALTRTVNKFRKVEKRFWWHWFWLIPKEVYEIYTETIQEYVVYLNKVVEEINRQIDTQANQIEQEVNNYLEKGFKVEAEQYIEYLSSYLKDYRTTLIESQEYQRKSAVEKEEVMKQLEQLEEDAQKAKCDIPIYSRRVEEVLENYGSSCDSPANSSNQ